MNLGGRLHLRRRGGRQDIGRPWKATLEDILVLYAFWNEAIRKSECENRYLG